MADISDLSTASRIDRVTLEAGIGAATRAVNDARKDDGHWVFELEADATIPAEYVLLRFYLGEPRDAELERKIGNYLVRIQGAHGGWPLVHEGDFDMSATVKAYLALKAIGHSIDAAHMVRAREAALARGGAIHSNVFTRFLLAMFGIVTWRATPALPVEIMLLPFWFPFHLNKISYWARTTLAPLLVLVALKKPPPNLGFGIDELFLQDPKSIGMAGRAPHQNRLLFAAFSALDAALHAAEPFFPSALRRKAIDKAVAFVEERLNGEDGLGAIYPPMANTVMMYDALGFGPDHPPRAITRRGLDKLVVIGDDEAYCQPCVSPVWDTGLACHAMLEAGSDDAAASARGGLDWLLPRQVLDVKGDWAVKRPDLRPGGWAFQYNNDYYPDLDDTAVVAMAMDRERRRTGSGDYDAAIDRAKEWIEGMQSRDGGWAAFDVDNLEYYLNDIPFSDHGALLDPPTEDVTARCVSMLAQLGDTAATSKVLAGGIDYLRRTQLPEGSWYGRWGLNYIYGTWSVLCALNAAGVDHQDPVMRRAVTWLLSIQNADGGWGEDANSYRLDYRGYERAPTTASQTAWALLALMAAGEVDHPATQRGIQCLISTQTEKGLWDEKRFTATGFPRVFYLRYHGYAKFFPLWAMARYRNLTNTNSRVVGVGM